MIVRTGRQEWGGKEGSASGRCVEGEEGQDDERASLVPCGTSAISSGGRLGGDRPGLATGAVTANPGDSRSASASSRSIASRRSQLSLGRGGNSSGNSSGAPRATARLRGGGGGGAGGPSGAAAATAATARQTSTSDAVLESAPSPAHSSDEDDEVALNDERNPFLPAAPSGQDSGGGGGSMAEARGPNGEAADLSARSGLLSAGGSTGGSAGGNTGVDLQDFTDDEIEELRDAFGMYDADGDGHISADELRRVISSLGQPVTLAQVNSMIRSVDENDDGEIDLPEFLLLMSRHGRKGAEVRRKQRAAADGAFAADKFLDDEGTDGGGTATTMDEHEIEELRAAFCVFDADRSGYITMDELAKLMVGLGQDLSRAELERMLAELDVDRDGQISFEEFKMLMSGRLNDKNYSDYDYDYDDDHDDDDDDYYEEEMGDNDEQGGSRRLPPSAMAAAGATALRARRSTIKASNHRAGGGSRPEKRGGRAEAGREAGAGQARDSSATYKVGNRGARVAPAPGPGPIGGSAAATSRMGGMGERQSSHPHLPPQYRTDDDQDELQRSAGSLQNVFEDSFGTLAVDVVASRPKTTGVGRYFPEIVDAEEHNLEYDFSFLAEPDDKGFSGFHKLINGIPYEGENHRGWRAVIEYINLKRAQGQLVLELQEVQKKTTPMLMTCCRKPPVEVVRAYIETTRTVLTQEHGRYHGMIPLHFACKFFASREVIALLVRERPDSIVWQDKSGRTPLHCALNNFESRLPPPHVIDLLLKATDDEGNVYTPVGMKNKNGCTPLHYLVFSSKSIDPNDPDQESDRDNAFACVDAYFRETDLDPQTLLKELMPFPYWLVGHVLRKDYVRKILNEIACSPFCANQLLTQLYAKSILIGAFWLVSLRAMEHRRVHYINNQEGGPAYFAPDIVVIYVAIAYLVIWELARVYSLVKMRMLNTWIQDPWNFVDVSCLGMVLASAILTNMGRATDRALWILFICSSFATWILLGSSLKAVNREWAIFLNGVVDIIKSLAAFFVMLVFTIMAFTHAYQLDARGMIECFVVANDTTHQRPDFCSFDGAMLKVFTMVAAGRVDDDLYRDRGSTLAITIVFAIVVSILLLNMIIAIMTRSQADAETRGEAFFYHHRFNVCVAVYKIYKLRPKKCRPAAGPKLVNDKKDKLQLLWDVLLVAFGDPYKAYVRDRKIKLDEQWGAHRFIKLLLLGAPKAKEANRRRRIAYLVIIPLWLIIGGLSFGRLWPPCVRRWLLCPDNENLRRQKVSLGASSHYRS